MNSGGTCNACLGVRDLGIIVDTKLVPLASKISPASR
jgi:hypothetical protein